MSESRADSARGPLHLVVGASGALGGSITRRLLERGEVVKAQVRGGFDSSDLTAKGAEIAVADLTNPDELTAACEGVDRIVATATAASRGGADTVEVVDRQGYENLVTAAEAAGVGQFVFVSAHGFEADSPVGLARAKVATEERLRASGLDYTILRPSLFMEVWIGLIVGAQLQAGPRVTVMGDPDRPYSFVAMENVADLALGVLGAPAASRTTLSLGGCARSYRQIVEAVGRAQGRELEIASVPPGTALPGFPPIVIELWTLMATGDVDAIETPDLATKYNFELISVEQALGAILSGGGH